MIFKFHVKFCNTLAENSTGQLETEVRLTRFNNVHTICLKQFHKQPVSYERLLSYRLQLNAHRLPVIIGRLAS